ncbi:hypothetical protein DPF_2323 [Desulfoplanes formicivorans]|uniref:Uncharacterized protein n=1 Tax=Desulfoplanes formicivorans TaxID=1592317 RepID=A0A194ALQ7_9BACT|nr:hypothetical protein DPF_2323 [Desulfoplanes formicivorans]
MVSPCAMDEPLVIGNTMRAGTFRMQHGICSDRYALWDVLSSMQHLSGHQAGATKEKGGYAAA